jgi:hypothetical protein
VAVAKRKIEHDARPPVRQSLHFEQDIDGVDAHSHVGQAMTEVRALQQGLRYADAIVRCLNADAPGGALSGPAHSRIWLARACLRSRAASEGQSRNWNRRFLKAALRSWSQRRPLSFGRPVPGCDAVASLATSTNDRALPFNARRIAEGRFHIHR